MMDTDATKIPSRMVSSLLYFSSRPEESVPDNLSEKKIHNIPGTK